MIKKIFTILFLFLISFVSMANLFFTSGRPATFDAPTHMTDIAGYSEALLSGDFPVYWLDKFGNYGMPVGFYSHQLPLTFAGILNIAIQSPVLTYYIFFFLGIFLTNGAFYLFLRLYFSRFASLAGITLLTFSAYRITNIYIRGDLPETFSGIFLGLILLGVYYFFVKNKAWGFFLIAFSYFCLAITHPMMLLTYSLLIFPYLFYVLLTNNEFKGKRLKHIFTRYLIKDFFLFFSALFLGVGMGMYFILPLFTETKYLYFGLEKNHLSSQFLYLQNFIGENWFYFYRTDIFTRGQFIQVGIIECITVLLGFISLTIAIIRRGFAEILSIPGVATVSTILVLFFTSIFSVPLYQHLSLLTGVQFPWRFLSVFLFLPPLFVASMLHKIKHTQMIILFVFLVAVIRFPQLYGKNYTEYPLQSYYFTTNNLFPILMNPIWTGKSEDYPVERQKIGIISGTGKIVSEIVHNSSRSYIVSAQTPLRLVDYTFYFPGWHAYIDGNETPIQFQDPNYRGVITYNVPQGVHKIQVTLKDTSIRKIAKILSLIFIGLFIFLFVLRKKIRT